MFCLYKMYIKLIYGTYKSWRRCTKMYIDAQKLRRARAASAREAQATRYGTPQGCRAPRPAGSGRMGGHKAPQRSRPAHPPKVKPEISGCRTVKHPGRGVALRFRPRRWCSVARSRSERSRRASPACRLRRRCLRLASSPRCSGSCIGRWGSVVRYRSSRSEETGARGASRRAGAARPSHRSSRNLTDGGKSGGGVCVALTCLRQRVRSACPPDGGRGA